MTTKSITLPHSALPDFNVSGHLNINFPDTIMSGASPKQILRYWVDDIYWRVRDAINYYYDEDAIYCDEISEELNNLSSLGHKAFVITYFGYTYSLIEDTVRFLDCLVDEKIRGIENITVAVCGIDSDEAYVLKEFLRLYHEIPQWNERQMCQEQCKGRIYEILYNLDTYSAPEVTINEEKTSEIPDQYKLLLSELVKLLNKFNLKAVDYTVPTCTPFSNSIKNILGLTDTRYREGLKELCKCNAITKVGACAYRINTEFLKCE